MCTEVWIDGEMIETLGGLRAKLGREPVYLDPENWYGPSSPDDCCLCGVAMAATAKDMGRKLDYNEWGDPVFIPHPRDQKERT